MNRCFVALLGFVAMMALAQPANAWIDTGHKVVALVGWEDLTPKTRTAITDILKQHPRYEKDLLLDAPEGAKGEDLDRHAFASAAIWPDFIKQQSHPMRATHNHPDWHYLDIPFVVSNQALPPEKQPTGDGPHNIVDALNKNIADLKDPKVSPADKAIAICWIAHLVGDIHQPLHCATEISPDFPKGDQGGNLQVVLRDPPYPDSRAKLHLIWDELPGDFKSEDLDRYEALGLRNDPRYARAMFKDALAVNDFKAWAQESHELAVKDAYLNGELKSSSSADRTAPRGNTPGLPPGYLEKAEHDAMHQVVLGGYRLADVLNGIFDVK